MCRLSISCEFCWYLNFEKACIGVFILWWVAVARDIATQQARAIVYAYHGLASIEPYFGSGNWNLSLKYVPWNLPFAKMAAAEGTFDILFDDSLDWEGWPGKWAGSELTVIKMSWPTAVMEPWALVTGVM